MPKFEIGDTVVVSNQNSGYYEKTGKVSYVNDHGWGYNVLVEGKDLGFDADELSLVLVAQYPDEPPVGSRVRALGSNGAVITRRDSGWYNEQGTKLTRDWVRLMSTFSAGFVLLPTTPYEEALEWFRNHQDYLDKDYSMPFNRNAQIIIRELLKREESK